MAAQENARTRDEALARRTGQEVVAALALWLKSGRVVTTGTLEEGGGDGG